MLSVLTAADHTVVRRHPQPSTVTHAPDQDLSAATRNQQLLEALTEHLRVVVDILTTAL